MNRFQCLASLLATVVLVVLGPLKSAEASTVSIDASGRGWMLGNPSNPYSGSGIPNGNTPGNNYVSGSEPGSPALFRNHFDFLIPTLPGKLVAATLMLDNPVMLDNPNVQGHLGGTHSYSVYSLGPFGTYSFSGIGSGTPYGSTIISASGAVNISLNLLARNAITAAQGTTFSIGGVNSGESLFPARELDFAYSGINEKSRLVLQFATVPEPSSLALAAVGCVALLAFAIRNRRAMHHCRA